MRTDRVSITTVCPFPKLAQKEVPSLALPSPHPARSFSAWSPGMAGRVMPSVTPRLGNVAGRPTGSHAGRPRPRLHAGFPGHPSKQPYPGGWCRPVQSGGPWREPPFQTRVPIAQPRRRSQVGGRGDRGPGRLPPLHSAHSQRAAARAAAEPAAARPPPAAPWPGPLRSLARRPPAAARSPACGVGTARPAPATPTPTPPTARPAPRPPRPWCQAPPPARPARDSRPWAPLAGADLAANWAFVWAPSPLRPGSDPARLPAKPGLESGMGRGPGLCVLGLVLPPHAQCPRRRPLILRPLKSFHTLSPSTNVTPPTGNSRGPRIPSAHTCT